MPSESDLPTQAELYAWSDTPPQKSLTGEQLRLRCLCLIEALVLLARGTLDEFCPLMEPDGECDETCEHHWACLETDRRREWASVKLPGETE